MVKDFFMNKKGNSIGIVANVLDYKIIVSEFIPQTLYLVNFGKGMNPFIPLAMGK